MKKILLLAIIAAAVLAACKDEKANGTLNVRLTDAPAAYDSVLVDVQELRINVKEEDESGWQTLSLDTTGQIDLFQLTEGNSILLTEEDLPVGHIAQMRLILGSNNEIVVDGERLPLDTPSAEQSGLKFNINATIEENKTYYLWVDFDAEKSIVEKGNGTYSLKPVISTYTTEE